MSNEKTITHSCPHCSGTGKQEYTVTVESIEELQTRVDENLTELAERFGELQSRVESAGKTFEGHILRVEKDDNPEPDFIKNIVATLVSNIESIDQEAYAVWEVLRDYEESGAALQAVLKEEKNG